MIGNCANDSPVPDPASRFAGRSRASGHTSQWRAGVGPALRTRLPIGTGRSQAGSRSVPVQGSGPATTSLSTRAGSDIHGSGVTCRTSRGSALASCASRLGVSPRGLTRVFLSGRPARWTA